MARPKTKQDLIGAANDKLTKLWELIGSMSSEEQNAAFTFDADAMGKEAHWKRDQNIRDVLVHLYEWHQLLLSWVSSNLNGKVQPFLPEPYNWKSYGDMNVGFWKMHQNTPYEKAIEMVKESHNSVMMLIEEFSNDELFSKGTFEWVGGSTLGQYCVSVTVSHYDWAMKKVKAHIKELK